MSYLLAICSSLLLHRRVGFLFLKLLRLFCAVVIKLPQTLSAFQPPQHLILVLVGCNFFFHFFITLKHYFNLALQWLITTVFIMRYLQLRVTRWVSGVGNRQFDTGGLMKLSSRWLVTQRGKDQRKFSVPKLHWTHCVCYPITLKLPPIMCTNNLIMCNLRLNEHHKIWKRVCKWFVWLLFSVVVFAVVGCQKQARTAKILCRVAR